MKTLYIIRHAKSSWDNPFLSDFDRPLNHRGLKNGPQMAKRMRKLGFKPDFILSSPANRALNTANFFAAEWHIGAEKLQTDRRLFHASEHEILRIIKETPEQIGTLAVFGHNPGLTDLANLLTDFYIENIPTTGFVAIDLEIENWNAIKANCGKLVHFNYPKKDESE